MKLLLQRVSHASVTVEGECISKIGQGLLVLIGIQPHDNAESITKAAHKIANYRMFSDSDDKMNLSVADISGEVLLVSQFTLAGDTKRGMRPSFSSAAKPDQAEQQYLQVAQEIRNKGINCLTGQFAADMKVELLNDGPVTFAIDI